jgi:hypothetical protein
MMLVLATTTLLTGHAHAQFLSPIHDVDNAARQAVQFSAGVEFTDGFRDSGTTFNFTVPAGKRLVIETISARIFVPAGQQVVAQISTELNNSSAFVFLPFNFKFTEDLFPEDDYIATIPVRIYSDPGTRPSVLVRRNSTQGESASGSVQCFGYLINLP